MLLRVELLLQVKSRSAIESVQILGDLLDVGARLLKTRSPVFGIGQQVVIARLEFRFLAFGLAQLGFQPVDFRLEETLCAVDVGPRVTGTRFHE